jgi:hypothetical protein
MSCLSLVPQCLQTFNLSTIWGTAHMRVIKQCQHARCRTADGQLDGGQ